MSTRRQRERLRLERMEFDEMVEKAREEEELKVAAEEPVKEEPKTKKKETPKEEKKPVKRGRPNKKKESK